MSRFPWWAFCAPFILGMVLDVAAMGAQDCVGQSATDSVIGALFGDASIACDLNGDGTVSAADLPAAILALLPPTPTASPSLSPTDSATATPTGTPSSSPTDTPTDAPSSEPALTETPTPTPDLGPSVSPTPASTATETLTPTPLLCPTTAAELQIDVDNQTGSSPISVTLSGARLGEECLTGPSMATAYTVTRECTGSGISNCAQVSDLAPGFWRHSITVVDPNTQQVQHQTSLLTVGSTVNRVRFTAFASVRSVLTTANTGDGSLRNLLHAADTDPKPLLIQFAPAAFPDGVPTAIQLQFQLPVLATDDVTIDGTDANGEIGNRVIDAQGDAGLSIPALAIAGARNHVIGMRLRNAGQNNRDVLGISGATADGNVIERTIIENAASADGIGVDAQAGKDFSTSANVIRDCEIRGAADKGIKITVNAYARVERCWVHDNMNGGIQATLGGHVQSLYNLVEHNLGSTAQNGLSVAPPSDPMSTAASELFSRGDISRGNGGNGIAVHNLSMAEVQDAYLATNAAAGIRVYNDTGASPATADVEGTSAVCNGIDGAVVANASVADFGGGALGSPGNNAFTQNNLPEGGANLRNATMPPLTVSAIDNQWEHCGAGTSCDDSAIASYDLSDHGANTAFMPSQAHRTQQPPVLTSVVPTKGRRGELLRIFGSGFNVIDGHFSEVGMQCADVAGRNRCLPVRGNCVKIAGVAAEVEAVTPTMLVVRWPFTCLQPVPLTVTTDQGPIATTSLPFTVCTNDDGG